ncbi:MAG: serine hydrolase [Planctomycetes bacterium]|nr:serine hydrolase [Planctomycetota bacterium]
MSPRTSSPLRTHGHASWLPRPSLALLAALGLSSFAHAQEAGGLDLAALLAAHSPVAKGIVEGAAEHRLQVLVAEVVEGPGGVLTLQRTRLGAPDAYFYPASSIKTAAAVAALEFLNELNAERGLPFGLTTELAYAPLFEDEQFEDTDPSNLEGGRITIGHEIRKLSIVSDNRAYNRLYELVGQERLDATLLRAGFPSFHLVHRLSEARTVEENLQLPSIALRDPGSETVFTLPARSTKPLPSPADHPSLLCGKAWVGGGDTRHEEPFRFHDKNRVDLLELQDFLVELVRPEIDTGRRGFPGLSVDQRAFLLEAMASLPRASTNPAYDPEKYTDDYVKFLLPGLARVVPAEHLRIWNKVGLAYGFTIENAYVEDARTGRGFFVAIALYTNPNETLNDGVYGYDELAFPFHAAVGEVLAQQLLAPRSAERPR